MKNKTAALDLFHDIEFSAQNEESDFLDIQSEHQDNEPNILDIEEEQIETEEQEDKLDSFDIESEQQDEDIDTYDIESEIEDNELDTLDAEPDQQEENDMIFQKNYLPFSGFPQLTGMMLPVWVFCPGIPLGIPVMALFPAIIYS